MSKDDTVYLKHILDAIQKIEEYTKDIAYEEFTRNNLIQDAVIREIEIIGEAAKALSGEFKTNSDIPWKKIAGMRDKLIHHYFGVDLNAVWKVVKQDLPVLKNGVEKLL